MGFFEAKHSRRPLFVDILVVCTSFALLALGSMLIGLGQNVQLLIFDTSDAGIWKFYSLGVGNIIWEDWFLT